MLDSMRSVDVSGSETGPRWVPIVAFLLAAFVAVPGAASDPGDRGRPRHSASTAVSTVLGWADTPPQGANAAVWRLLCHVVGGNLENIPYDSSRASRDNERTEELLAARVAAQPPEVESALLAHLADKEADPGRRCVLARMLTSSVARSRSRACEILAMALLVERPGFLLWEACGVAGRASRERNVQGATQTDLAERALWESALTSAATRLEGWGRQYAVWALGFGGFTAARPQIRAALSDAEPAVRRHAALALARLGDTDDGSTLARMSRRDPDPVTRDVAAHAHALLTGRADVNLARGRLRLQRVRR